VDDPTEDGRFGRVGKQKIEDTGRLTNKRMETVDEEFLGAAMSFIDKNSKANKPFFCWFNSTRMHINTHLKPASDGKTGLGVEADGMVEHDGMVGQLLKQLDDLGIADNTIVLYTTDNGAEVFSWPDGGTTPFHGEKNASWEGGYRVPGIIRWPGVVKPGTEINDIVSHEDWVPTLVGAAGEPNITEKLLSGYQGAGKTFKVYLDGDMWLDYVPLRLPDTICVQQRLPPGAAAVLINPTHTYTDLYLPIDAQQKQLFDAIDGERTIGEIARKHGDPDTARALFERLWWYDQVVFDTLRHQSLPSEAKGSEPWQRG
jgi:hypothetical protein